MDRQRPSIDDLGRRIVCSTLPHLPDSLTGEFDYEKNIPLFNGHPEARTLAKIYKSRLATRHMVDPQGQRIEIGLVNKNHPYLLHTPFETMVQYFGARPVLTPAEWRDESFYIGMEYFTIVAEAMKTMMSLVEEPADFVVSTNCAPYSKFSKPLNVQSVSAPHSHILAITEREVEQSMRFLDNFSSNVERRKYAGLGSAINRLYRQLVAEAFVYHAADERGNTFDEIGAEKFSPLTRVEGIMSLKNRSDTVMPPGFSFTLNNGLDDIASPEFLSRLTVFDEALKKIYTELAAIFFINYQEIPHIGARAEEAQAMRFRDHEKIIMQCRAFIDRYVPNGHIGLSTESAQRLLSLSHRVCHYNLAGSLLGNIITRGHAYSIILRPEDRRDPYGPWKVSLPLWIYGGGGVEGTGIEKERLTEEDPRNAEYIQQYMSHAEERAMFTRNFINGVKKNHPTLQTLI